MKLKGKQNRLLLYLCNAHGKYLTVYSPDCNVHRKSCRSSFFRMKSSDFRWYHLAETDIRMRVVSEAIPKELPSRR